MPDLANLCLVLCRQRSALRVGVFALVVARMLLSHAAAGEVAEVGGLEFFEKRIRPVLVAQCYECHSANSKSVRGGLLVDSRDALRVGGDSGPAVEPGKPEESLLLAALRYEGFEMPPSGKLSDEVLADFAKWIAMGAPDPREAIVNPSPQVSDPLAARDHWSFQPMVEPRVPPVSKTEWSAGDVDRFILARLEAEDLQPGVDAEPAILARRGYLDLIGLPPTPEEVAAFESAYSHSPQGAWIELVDRLLASPHYGERWGRHWLDLARYADSTGGGRSMIFGSSWRYRDYVIAAFNDDMPYDQFLVEQIAGDLLPYDDYRDGQRQVVATAFLALGPTNYEEQNKRQLRMDVVDEQIDTVGRTFLGMTIGCARCHDHKFDPIPTADYYALAGIFRSTHTLVHANVSNWVERPLPLDPVTQQAREAYEARLAELTNAVQTQRDAVRRLRDELPLVTLDDGEAKLVGSWQASASVKPFVGDGYRYASGQDVSAQYKLTGRVTPGQYEVRVSYTPHANRSRTTRVTIQHAAGSTDVVLDQTRKPAVDELYVSLGRFTFADDSDAFVEIAAGDDGRAIVADAVQCLPAEVPSTSAASGEGSSSPGAVVATVDFTAQLEALRDGEVELKALETRLKQARAEAPPAPPTTMAVGEEETEVGDFHVCIRGNIDNLGEVVPRGFLRVIESDAAPSSIPAGASGRLELAQWIASSEHPLTSRVMVNRIWQHLFGQGIVRSADNFGTTGELPSHPELLDYLARRFVAEGWSTKKLIRDLMLSRTYRLASQPLPASIERDPDNRLLSHQNRRRLDAEILYDSMLALGGNLDRTAGGETVRKNTKSEYGYEFEVGRRAVYLPIFRNNLPDLFAVFDFPDPNLSMGTRTTSTLSTQALFFLNSPFTVGQARLAAESLLAVEGLDDDARLELWYRRALARAPRSSERSQALEFLARRSVNGAEGQSSDIDRWSAVCHAVMASVDFRYVD